MSVFPVLLHLLFWLLAAAAAMPDPYLLPLNEEPPPSPLPPGPEELEGRNFGWVPGGNVSFPGGEVGGAGEAGEMGEAYCQMLLESPVPLPADQVPWFCICSHCQGRLGPKGDAGERGLPGSPGSAGSRGLTGVRGRPGFTGPQGIKGQKGDEGLKGDRGPEGPLGPKGGRGYKGDKGEAGLEGPSGDPGVQGEEGVCPESCQAVEGPAGGPGLPGSTGPRGLPGPGGPGGSGGLKGDPGVQGAEGPPGAPGPKGEVGPEGECSCEDGAEGRPGESGQKGEAGSEGPSGLKGETGGPGPKGDLGEMGVRGVPGPCMPAVQSAFSMGLGSSFPPPNTPVAFTQVISNLQGHYDPLVGIYTAPVNGTYVFSYSLTVYARVLKVGLFHNFIPLVKTTYPIQLGTAAHQLVLHLAQGDGVWLQVKDQLTNGIFTSSETSSTFSGFLLHPDSCYMAELRQSGGPLVSMSGGGSYDWGTLPGPTAPAVTNPPTTTTTTTGGQ